MTTRIVVLLLSATLFAPACSRGPAQTAQAAEPASPASGATQPSVRAMHPLDPLTDEEIRSATRIVRADARFATAAFHAFAAAEPAKRDVLAWQPGQALPRAATIQAVSADGVFEIAVDITGNRIASATARPGAGPPITMTEIEATQLVLQHAEFKAGLAKRGVTDTAKVFCAPFSAGYYGNPAHEGKRLVKVGCFDTRRTTTNLFGWPIERLYALVDLKAREVLSVTDYGVVPISDAEMNYTEAAAGTLRAPRKPTVQAQPAGSNVVIDGHQVTWGNWRFHARVDPRVGTVISVARWQDAKGARSVLYQGYLSEMFVPYMDADYGWQSRTYFDTGEYGAGLLATPLAEGADCPATATFVPAVFANDKGEPFTTPNALCIFERSLGEPLWRHSEVLNQTYEGRANVELVVRMATTIGNYDYLFDWVFNDAAEIQSRVGATGIDALKGVASKRMADATAAADTKHGTLVAPNIVAVNHDHYFNFRLDVDVDGTGNTFNQDVYKTTALPADSARKSIYLVERRLAATEKDAQLSSGHGPSRWRVINESKTNGVGNPASFEVLATNHARLIIDPTDWPARRARFLEHDVWVTPYEPTERYAAGQYLLGSKGDDGLAVWASRNRTIRNEDIVLWVNLGMHHLTRSEDIPVMPMIWHSFTLRPHNFFDRNPGIDLRREGGSPSLPSASSARP